MDTILLISILILNLAQTAQIWENMRTLRQLRRKWRMTIRGAKDKDVQS